MPLNPSASAEKRGTNFSEWSAAIGAVAAKQTPEAFASILGVFYDHGWSGKELVISLFGDKPDALIFPVLERATRDGENANLRNAAMEIFVALGNRSLPPLLTLLRDQDSEIRTFAGVMLGNLKEREAVPHLIKALADPDLNVKHAAAEALGKIRDPRAVDALIEALHTDMWLQFPAAVALGDLGDSRAVGPLCELLALPGANIPAIQALGKIGDPAALGALARFLEDDEASLREWALEAVAALIPRCRDNKAAGAISGKAVALVLETLKSDSLKARRNAVVALGHFKIREAVSALTGLLSDGELREDALEAIVRIGGESALGQLAAYTREADPLVRQAAVEALAGIGSDKSVKAILPLLEDPVEEVRMQAALSLARFESDEARRALARMFSDMKGAVHEAEKKALEALAALAKAPQPAFACDREDLLPLRDYVSERLGLYYDDDRLNVLLHRLSPIAVAGGFRSLREYYRHLTGSAGRKDNLDRLASQLTNNETYFFREKEQLNAFAQSVLPGMVHRKSSEPQRTLRVLSAGCSTGEEPYTIAMLVEDAGVRSQGCNVEVIGLDIDPGALSVGKSARYSARSFRGGENGAAKKYFKQEGESFVLHDGIKRVVQFRQGNVLSQNDLGQFDVIFCRNVLIYFSDKAVERAMKNFFDMLVNGGYLLLGHSESLCRINTDFVPVRLDGAVVYQKE